MKSSLFPLVLTAIFCVQSQAQTNIYLKQKPPGNTPEVFALNIISTDNEYEFGSVFNAAGTEFYYGVSINGKEEMRYSELVGESWSAPKTIMVHKQYGYNDPFLSPDENRLYFISKRALDGKSEPKDYDIWYVERQDNNWSEPINAGKNINTSSDEYYISFTNDGTMYFASGRTNGNFDIYTSKFKNGKFQKAVALPSEINTSHYEADVFVAPDESYVIFCGNRPDGFGRGDLYISFKNEDGSWTQSVNMGSKINTRGHELCPFVTKDGKYFFYSSNQDIYWVSASIIDDYRK
ncbi:MAG: hypothetical protein ED556_08065 [Winogradskyella sp.]|uniref:hypothetical protein n=1 Tax=Winogradskyella sp. TaxID=1883156 RepID=UPI000F3E2A3F|nr:hypothetical protein [Winogradskyella sp.]RNC86244.1 MAG: hypothetical protein ED556_08065 [Winogradskyella sp.]